MEIRWLWRCLLIIATISTIHCGDKTTTKPNESQRETEEDSSIPKSRQKRLIWVTDDGRLALPPGTSLTISPTLALPFVRYPPDGFFSNISISLPLTIDFDKLGLTDNQNPLGVLPSLFGRSMGRAAGSILANYVSSYLKSRRKRAIDDSDEQSNSDLPFKITRNRIDEEEDPEPHAPLPEEHKHAFHGGERALLYATVEDFLSTFGMNGKSCLLRAICEIHSKPISNFGLFGEMIKLFFTASKSPFSHLMDEYVAAERIGAGELGPGECFPYFKECPKSLFAGAAKNKYVPKKRESSDEHRDKSSSSNGSSVEFNSNTIAM